MFGIKPVGLARRPRTPGDHRTFQRILAEPLVKFFHIEHGYFPALAPGEPEKYPYVDDGWEKRQAVSDHRIPVPVGAAAFEPVAAPLRQFGKRGHPPLSLIHI